MALCKHSAAGCRDDMSEEDAVALVAKAIRAGIFNDLGSGSNVDVCIIRKDGVDYRRNMEYLQVRCRALLLQMHSQRPACPHQAASHMLNHNQPICSACTSSRVLPGRIRLTRGRSQCSTLPAQQVGPLGCFSHL